MNKLLMTALVAAIIGLGACTMGAMSTEEIGSVQANCENVEDKIAMLEQEKAENNRRIAAGVGSVFPGTALSRLATGRYETNVKIATGEWAQLIDRKLVELQTLKAACDGNRHLGTRI